MEGTPHGKGFRYDKNGAKTEVDAEKGRVNKHKDNNKGIVASKSTAKIGLSNYFIFFVRFFVVFFFIFFIFLYRG